MQLADTPVEETQASEPVANPLENSAPAPAIVERDEQKLSRSLQLACRCAATADGLKAGNVVVLDLTQITPEFDYFVIASGNSRRQLHAIAEEVDSMMSAAGNKRLGVEGYHSDAWILQDYGDIVLHVFEPKNRDLYDLERLWGDATRIDWQATLNPTAPSTPATP